MLTYCQLDFQEQTFESKYQTSFETNVFENVIPEMAAILFRLQWVNIHGNVLKIISRNILIYYYKINPFFINSNTLGDVESFIGGKST